MKATVTYTRLVGQVIRQKRELLGISSLKMSKAMDISASGWSRIETGDTTITVAQLRKAARFLCLKPHVLIQRADELEANMKRDGMKIG